MCFYPQGLILVQRCSQLTGAWLPAAGTPLLQGRPGHGNRLVIGPAALGGLVWWHKQEPQQGSRAEFRLDAWTASYPREVLRGERPKRVLVPFDRAKGTPSGERPRQAGKPEPWVVRRTTPQSALRAASSPYTGEPLGLERKKAAAAIRCGGKWIHIILRTRWPWSPESG